MLKKNWCFKEQSQQIDSHILEKRTKMLEKKIEQTQKKVKKNHFLQQSVTQIRFALFD